jgi:hypothetical protein
MRRMLSLGLCLASLCAMSALAAPGALANVLTLKTVAGAIASGGELKAASSNLTFTSGSIKIECASAEEVGHLVVNHATVTQGSFTSFAASGCKTAGGAASLVACSTEWPTSLTEQLAKFGEKRTGGGKKAVCLEATTVEGGSCKYNAEEISSKFNIGGAETITTEEQEFPAIGCKEKKTAPGILSQTQSLTSHGETVEAVSEATKGSGGGGGGPVWYECAKGAKGKGFEKGCAKEGGKGGYELKIGVGKGKAFKTKGGEAKLHTVVPEKGDVPVVCGSFKGSGNAVVPDRVAKVVTVFSKCKAAGAPCQSGSKKETIETKATEGELGYLSKTGPKVGLELQPEGGGFFATFTCTGVAGVRTAGSVIAEVTGDVDKFSKTSQNVFTVGAYLGEVEYAPGKKFTPLVNEPFFEGSGTPHLLLSEFEQGKGWEPEGGLPSGQEATASIKGEELGIKA